MDMSIEKFLTENKDCFLMADPIEENVYIVVHLVSDTWNIIARNSSLLGAIDDAGTEIGSTQ